MADDLTKCPLCGWDAKITHLGETEWVRCELCGEFKIVRSLLATAFADPESQETKDLLPYLRAHTRQASERGDVVTLHTRNWKDFAVSHKNTPTPRKVTKLLELVASRSKPGITAQLNPAAEAPLIDAASTAEIRYFLRHLVDIGYLNEQAGGNYLVTVKGWTQIEGAGIAGTSGKCFVAMSFHDSLRDAYESGIFLAVKGDCKMDPIRLDFVQHNEKICDKIIADIRASQFVVADVTLASQNVYFEAGFAMGLNRPVIWTCRDDRFHDDTRFDTRQYPYIRWKDSNDLRTQLTDRIKATIPGAVQ